MKGTPIGGNLEDDRRYRGCISGWGKARTLATGRNAVADARPARPSRTRKHGRLGRPDVIPHGMVRAGSRPHAGRIQKAITAHWTAAAAITSVWKTS